MDPHDLSSWPEVAHGNYFEDHTVGRTFDHHWGRTIHASDNIAFSTQNLSFDARYFNRHHAQAAGAPDEVINPMLVFTTVFGLSVEDLSELGGAFLGAQDVEFLTELHPGDTVYARSEVVKAVESASRPDYGIVTWHTSGHLPDGTTVIRFQRTNMIPRRRVGSHSIARPSGDIDSFHIGQRMKHPRSRTVTDIDLNGMTLAVMNTADGHFSEAAMAGSEFGSRINFGGLTLSLTVGLATQDTSGQCRREVSLTDIRFRSPVRHGDSIVAYTEVIAIEEAAATVTFQHYGANQDGQIVCEAKRTIEVGPTVQSPDFTPSRKRSS